LGSAGSLREAVILKSMAFDRKADFLKTIMLSRAATLDTASAEQMESYKKLVHEYEDMFYYRIKITKEKNAEGISEEMLKNLIGTKKGKMHKISFTAGKKIEKELVNTSIVELTREGIKKE